MQSKQRNKGEVDGWLVSGILLLAIVHLPFIAAEMQEAPSLAKHNQAR